MRSRFGATVLMAIMLALAAALALVQASRMRLASEKALSIEADRFIDSVSAMRPEPVQENDLKARRERLADDQRTILQVVSDAGPLTEIRYFRGRTLVAIDLRDGDELLRRDVVDAGERVRVQTFYRRQRPYLVHYIDANGDVTVEALAPILYLPWPAYQS